MFAYKGFQRGLKCRGYQFSMGKNVTEAANCGQNGFHCAENPLDCLSYYGNINFSDYCLVIPGGDMDEDQVDSKISCTELTIVKKLTIQEFSCMDWPIWWITPTVTGAVMSKRTAEPPHPATALCGALTR